MATAGAEPEDEPAAGIPSMRSDAVLSRERILRAASSQFGHRRITMAEVAAAARVGRSTLYRHFPSRLALERELERFQQHADARTTDARISERIEPLPFQAPGELGRDTPLALEVTRILDEVPPHLVPDQLVAEARRVAGVPVALYVVDIDGSKMLRLAGSEEFPDELDAPPAVGPEIVPEGLPEYEQRLQSLLPGCVCEALWLRGRVTALLLCVGAPMSSLGDLARQGAAALELANAYTDVIEATRRRKPTTPAAEIQQQLFPPRVTKIAGGQLAGVLQPSYEVGGDWFDFVENRDGAWLAIADAAGTGPTAAGLGAAALGALRAARRSGQDLEAALELMDETVRRLEHEDFFVTVWLARWRAATSTLSWVNCGHPAPYVVEVNGELHELTGREYPALGTASQTPSYHPTERRLQSGERLVLITDGISERKVKGGGTFGVDGIRAAVAATGSRTAAGTALAIQKAVTDSWREPLEDDATVVVMAVD